VCTSGSGRYACALAYLHSATGQESDLTLFTRKSQHSIGKCVPEPNYVSVSPLQLGFFGSVAWWVMEATLKPVRARDAVRGGVGRDHEDGSVV
jgi:hypothetical protein